MPAQGLLETLVETLQQLSQHMAGVEAELRQLRRVLEAREGLATTTSPSMEQNDMSPEPDASHPEERLRQWLKKRQLVLEQYRLLPPESEAWDWFALFLGRRFDHVQLFYEKWKRALSARHPSFTLQMQDAPPEHISDVNQLAHRLREASLISDFHYYRPTRTLRVTPAFMPYIINFVTGGWLERFLGRLAYEVGQRVLGAQKVLVFRKVVVTLPNKQQGEMDVVILSNGDGLWLESTTGDYNPKVERWKRLNDYLRLSSRQAAVVLLEDISPTARAMVETLTGMWVLSLPEVEAYLEQALEHLKKTRYPNVNAQAEADVGAKRGG